MLYHWVYIYIINTARDIMTLDKLADLYRTMPNKGARLTVSGGTVGNGLVVVAQFATHREACRQLMMAGFVRDGKHWVLPSKAR